MAADLFWGGRDRRETRSRARLWLARAALRRYALAIAAQVDAAQVDAAQIGAGGMRAMPKYDFQCTSCEAVFEMFRGFAQGTDGVVCPEDGEPATRLFSPPMDMIVFGSKNSNPTTQIRPPGPRLGGGGGGGGHGHSHGPGGHSHGPGSHTH